MAEAVADGVNSGLMSSGFFAAAAVVFGRGGGDAGDGDNAVLRFARTALRSFAVHGSTVNSKPTASSAFAKGIMRVAALLLSMVSSAVPGLGIVGVVGIA